MKKLLLFAAAAMLLFSSCSREHYIETFLKLEAQHKKALAEYEKNYTAYEYNCGATAVVADTYVFLTEGGDATPEVHTVDSLLNVNMEQLGDHRDKISVVEEVLATMVRNLEKEQNDLIKEGRKLERLQNKIIRLANKIDKMQDEEIDNLQEELENFNQEVFI